MFKVGDIIRPKPSANKFYSFTNTTYVETMVVTAINTKQFLAKVKEFTDMGDALIADLIVDTEYPRDYKHFELAFPTKKLKLISRTRIK